MWDDIKPSVFTWLVVGLMAVTFIILLKFVTTKWTIPGVSEIAAAV